VNLHAQACKWMWRLLVAGVALLMVACADAPVKPQPAALTRNPELLTVRQVWSSTVGRVTLPLQVGVAGQTVSLGSDDGQVLVLDASTGVEQWRLSGADRLAAGLSAGLGGDGSLFAAVSANNELIVWKNGRELWRQQMSAQVFTAPLVAGARVFVLTADRVVLAFDGATGRKLWSQTRSAEPLVLRQAGVLLPVGDTLLVGLSGRLLGLNPGSGSIRWEVPIASPRGVNEIERLVDLVAGVSRQGDEVCVRAFQSAVGCVNTSRGKLTWGKPAVGAVGLDGDDRLVVGAEGDGKLVAWRRADGERAWTSELLKFRGLTGPLVLGRSVVVGDAAGYLHFLSREDGSLLARVATDGSGIAATPVVAGKTLVVVTRNGGVFAYRPD